MLGLFDFTLWTGSHIFRNSNVHNKRSKGSYRKVRKIQMLLLWLNHKNQVKWSNHYFFRWISTAYNTVYYIIRRFFPSIGQNQYVKEQWFIHVPNKFIYFLFSYYSSYYIIISTRISWISKRIWNLDLGWWIATL